MSYFVMIQSAADDKDVAVIATPTNDALGLERWQLHKGVQVADRFKAGMTLAFHASYKGRKLVDLQTNPWGGFIVSPRLRALLEREPQVEFLPVQLADHRGKVVSTDYSLANCWGPVDCLDLSKSDCNVDAMDTTKVDWIRKMVIDAKKVPKGRHAFRLTARPRTVLLEAELAKAIKSAKLTGVGCVAEEEYDSTGVVGV